jgi:hypothetical protein
VLPHHVVPVRALLQQVWKAGVSAAMQHSDSRQGGESGAGGGGGGSAPR